MLNDSICSPPLPGCQKTIPNHQYFPELTFYVKNIFLPLSMQVLIGLGIIMQIQKLCMCIPTNPRFHIVILILLLVKGKLLNPISEREESHVR